MNHQCLVESNHVADFVEVMPRQTTEVRGRLNLDGEQVKNGLGQLVLTVVRLLHELLEKQAIRRMESGSLMDDEVERLGETLMQQSQEIERLRLVFGLEEDDLDLDLGPLGRLLGSGGS